MQPLTNEAAKEASATYYCDPVVTQQPTISKGLLLLHSLSLSVSIAIVLRVAYLSREWGGKLAFGLAALGFAYQWFKALQLWVDGNTIVRSLTVYPDHLMIRSLPGWSIRVPFTNMRRVTYRQPPWVLGESPWFDHPRPPSLVIHLKNGRFYRLTPHMPQQRRLRQQLQSSIHNP